jgi:hypothetical protein
MDRETGPEPTTAIRPLQQAGSLSAHTHVGDTAPLPAVSDSAAEDDPAPGPDTDEFAPVRTRPDQVADGQAGRVREAWQTRRVGFPSRLIMSQLAVDPRVPIWSRRAVVAVVIVLGFTFWLGWRVGLTIAALAAIADTIYQSKTVSLIPAAARIASAQRRTRHRLLAGRVWGYHALHARPIPGTESIIDHLVIGPGGVFAIDSERWDRRLPVRTVASNSAAGPVLYHGPFTQKDRLAHARWEAAQAAYLLGRELGQPVTVRPAMVIYGPKVPWSVARLRGVDVMGGRTVVRYFVSRKRANPDTAITWEQAGDIAAAAERAMPPG